ncbi:MAG TPA: O-antigen ligase family protein [Gaiellaceae bacterium]|nr:O-antigen ligase family protein [Gaiellaceae bacterium]
MADALALALYVGLIAAAAALVWRRPLAALYVFIVGLALHNAVLAALYAAGVRGATLTAIQAWKEILLAVALGRVALDAWRARRLPFRPGPADWLGVAFATLCVAYALIPQSALGGHATRHAVALAFRHDVVPVAVFLVFRSLPLARDDLRRLGWTLLAAAGAVAAWGLIDVYALPIGWWRTNGVVAYFRDQLGYRYNGTGHLPENFIYSTGSDKEFLRRLVSTFLSPLATAYMLVVALLLAPRRRAALPLAALVFAGLLFTFSRSSLIALAGGLVVLALAGRRLSLVVAAVLVVAVAVGWAHAFPHVGPTGHWTKADLVYQHSRARQTKGTVSGSATSVDESSFHSHLVNLKDGVRTVVHHPQGFGLGNVGQTAARTGTPIRAGESNYTELGAELGILGMVLWTAWNLAILVRLRSAPTMAAAFAAILILAIQTDVIGDPWVAYVVWGLAGALSAGPARLLASGARKTARRDAK